MHLIDTHAHLFDEKFSHDIDCVLENAYKTSIKDIIIPAIDISSLNKMKKISSSNVNLHYTSGLHPTSIRQWDTTIKTQLEQDANKNEVIAIGETGLDYYWSTNFINEQKRYLDIHCSIAKMSKKPLILHNRNSTKDLLHIIKTHQDGNLSGVWHCFDGTLEEAKQAVDIGLYLGIGGIWTYKTDLFKEILPQLPLDHIILETDSPYLSPKPMRGTRNEPAHIKHILKKIADILHISQYEIANRTTINAKKLFNI